jgi:glycosyltransferase involved in cell wall biosynthesis
MLELLGGQHANVKVLVHPRNRGKGVALLAAFSYALAEVDFDVLVTLDADGQHRACDIIPLAQALRTTGAALAIGARDRFAEMPLRSRIGNEFMGKIIRWAFPSAPADTQSGFRAHTRQFIVDIAERMKGQRYETELKILVSALKRGPVATITIPTVYQDNNRSSHFQPLRDSLRVLVTLGKLWLSDMRPARRI